MKKLVSIIIAIALSMSVFAALSACDNKVVNAKSFTVKSGIKSAYVVGEEIDTSNVVITVTMSDGSTKEISVADGITFSEMSSAEPGEYTVTVSYLSLTLDVSYIVRWVEYEVIDIASPDSIVNYNNNIAEQDNKKTEFYFRDEGYLVGDDNEFLFVPKLFALDDDDNRVTVTSYTIDYNIYVMGETEYEALTEENIASYVSVNVDKGAFDFTADAIGKQFKIEVGPKYKINGVMKKVSFEFKVVDGYNVYSAKDLSVVDNFNADWNAYRTSKGITANPNDVNAVILQNDISVKTGDFPSSMLYNEGDSDVKASDADYGVVIGTLRDYVSIYCRTIPTDEKFDVIGNYYTLDASSMPYVIRDDGDPASVDAEGKISEVITSHSQLFYIGSSDGTELAEEFKDTVQCNFKNINMIGNAARSEDLIKSGGLIMSKMNAANTTYYNIIANQWFITYFSLRNKTTRNIISNCKAYDAYNSIIYAWGVGDMVIDNCELIGAGGPVIIADHIFPSENSDRTIVTNISVTDSTLESYVTGSEGWFTSYNAASAVAGIIQMDAFYNYFGRTFTKKENKNGTEITQINIIALFKSGEAEAMTTSKIEGSMAIDNEYSMNFTDPTTAAVLSALAGSGAPLFQSKAGFGYFTGSALIDPLTQSAIASADHGLFSGDYLNLYYNIAGSEGFMGIVLGGYGALNG